VQITEFITNSPNFVLKKKLVIRLNQAFRNFSDGGSHFGDARMCLNSIAHFISATGDL